LWINLVLLIFIFSAKKRHRGWADDEEVSARRWLDQCWSTENIWWRLFVPLYKKSEIWQGDLKSVL
jgi:hypothetical protein